jgi:Fe-S cluster assembly protein SufD
VTGSLLINPTAFDAGLEAAFLARKSTNRTQEAAFERFAKQRLPNRRREGWKWSDFNTALRARELGAPSTPESLAPSAFSKRGVLEFRIINGRIEVPEGDLPEGVRYGVMDAVGTIAELEAHPIASLNVAMTAKSLGIEVDKGVRLKQPILIRHIDNGSAPVFAQSMLRIEVGASAKLIETWEGDSKALSSRLFHISLRDGAALERFVLDQTSAETVTHSIFAVKLDKDAHFKQTSLSGGARLSRHETIAHFWGEGAAAEINSAALLSGERHADFTTHVLHKQPNCMTRQVHKGVATDRGRAVFQGKFEVEREAQKTDAQMTANALLLSDGAEANHKPELEIYADDVECAHGSTCGALDDDALFYLRQRGLSARAARALLIEAFAGEVIEGIEDDAVRDVFRECVANWLENER